MILIDNINTLLSVSQSVMKTQIARRSSSSSSRSEKGPSPSSCKRRTESSTQLVYLTYKYVFGVRERVCAWLQNTDMGEFTSPTPESHPRVPPVPFPVAATACRCRNRIGATITIIIIIIIIILTHLDPEAFSRTRHGERWKKV